MKRSISAFSGSKREHLSSYISVAPENRCSEPTEVGGADKYLSTNTARTGNRAAFCVHQVKQFCL